MIKQNRDQIKRVLESCKTIAVVGLSPKENRPSNMVARYLMGAGYQVIPVNPGQSEILGQTCYPNISSIPVRVDMVDIFRKPEDIVLIVKEAIACNIENIWMQLGIVNQEAATLAAQHNCFVVMDECIKIVHQELL